MSFQFKFDASSLAGVEKNVRDAFNKVITNPRMLNEIGSSITTDIVDQTRNKEKSIPLKSDLKLLKESTIRQRMWLKNYNLVDRTFEDGRSNLTLTGQLLNSLTHRILGSGILEIFFDGKHRPYKGKNKTLGKDGVEISNEQLAQYVADAGRPIVGVRPAIRLRINTIVKTYIKRALVVARLDKN